MAQLFRFLLMSSAILGCVGFAATAKANIAKMPLTSLRTVVESAAPGTALEVQYYGTSRRVARRTARRTSRRY